MTVAWDPLEVARLARTVRSEAMEDDDIDVGAMLDQIEAAAVEIDRLTADRSLARSISEALVAGAEHEFARLGVEVERLTARHDSSMRYLRDIENMASTGTQSAVMREDSDGDLRLAIFRDIRTAARTAIAGDELRLNEAVEIDRLTADVERLEQQRTSAGEALVVVTAERDAYRAMVCDLLASAHPNERDHPCMSKQWARARELLANHENARSLGDAT